MPRSRLEILQEQRLSPLVQAIVAVGSVAIATVIQVSLGVAIRWSTPFLFLYVLPIGAAGYLGGRIAGIAAAVLSTLTAWFVFFPPLFSFALTALSASVLAIFMTVGIATALASSHLRRIERERLSLYRVERAGVRKQEAVARLGQCALTSTDLSEVMREAVTLLTSTLDMDFARVLELLPGGHALLLRAGVGWREGLVGSATVPADPHSQAGFTLRSARPVIVEDLRTETRFRAPAFLADHRVVSGISAIIGGKDRPFGVLGVDTTKGRIFTEDDVHFVAAVANVLAAAIQRHSVEETLRDREDRLRLAIEAGHMGTWAWDMESGRVTWSPNLEEIHGLAPGAFEGTFDAFKRDIHSEDRDRVLASIGAAMSGEASYDIEYRIIRPEGQIRWLAARGQVVRAPDGRPVRMAGVCSDVTDRRLAEEERARLLAQEQAARAEAEAARERQAFLAGASTVMASSLDYSTTLRNVARAAVPQFADWCVFDLVQPDGSLQRVAILHRDPAKLEIAAEIVKRYPPDPNLPEALRTGRAQLFPEITEELLQQSATDADHLGLLSALRLKSAMIIPLIARGRTLGALYLATAESGRFYREEDLAVAEELGRRAALFVDNARLYAREHQIAETLQRAFLPEQLPRVPGLTIHAAYVPGATESELGGDWYDAFRLPDGRILLSIGDVTGRGLQAAVTMGQIRQAIRAAAYEGDAPAAILTRASRLLQLSGSETMATAMVGILDPAKTKFSHATAGHPTPLLALSDGTVKALPSGGTPLGFRNTSQVPAVAGISLPPGSLLVMYTDGLIELDRNPIEGEARLITAIRVEAQAPSANPARAILDRLLAGRETHDDVAVLAVAADPFPLMSFNLSLPAIPSSLPLVRQSIQQLANGLGIDPDRVAALQIAVGEAVNNVIEHAYGVSPGNVQIRAREDGARLVVEILDSGEWRPARDDGRGRGLRIMRALADDASIETTPSGTIVRLGIVIGVETEEHKR